MIYHCRTFHLLVFFLLTRFSWPVVAQSNNSSDAVVVDCSGFRAKPIQLVLGELFLNAIINPVEDTLTAELVFVGQAWIALGFTPLGSPLMTGAQAVIGYPDRPTGLNNPGKYQMAGYMESDVGLMDESRQTLVNATLEQNNTHTVLQFTKYLQESNEHTVSSSGQSTFIWAIGIDNSFAGHIKRGGFTAKLRQCAVTTAGVVSNPGDSINNDEEIEITVAEDNRSLWIAHGATAAVAWAILVPLAIGSSLLRKLVEQALPSYKGLWFTIHRNLNALAAILTLTSFAIAVSIINKQPGASHFTKITHNTLGLVIFILTMLQSVNGFLRPSLAKPTTPDEQPGSTAAPSGDASRDTYLSGLVVGGQDNARFNQDRVPEYSADEVYNNSNVVEEEQDNVKAAPPTDKSPTIQSKSTIRILWEYGHRILGLALLGMAWWQVQDGLGLYYERFADASDLTPAFWGVAAGISVAVIGLYIVQWCTVKNMKTPGNE